MAGPPPRVSGQLQLVLSRLERVKRCAGGWAARCPAHDDGNPSLKVSEGRAQPVVIDCKAGCTAEAVLGAINLSWGDVCTPRAEGDREQPVAIYDYRGPDGALRYQVLRFAGKQFRQRRVDANGEWVWNMDGVERVLYHAPEVAAAAAAGETIYLVEGEKDANALIGAGVVATSAAGGAQGKWLESYTEALKGAHVVLVADNDGPGLERAEKVAEALSGAGVAVKKVRAVEGKDAYDHLVAGHSPDAFVSLDPEPELGFLTPRDLIAHVARVGKVGWLARPVWPADAYGILAAEPKAGKTWTALDLAVSVAMEHGSWMEQYDVERSGPVTVFLGEGGHRKMLRRLEAICRHKDVELDDLPLRLCFRAPHLASVEHMALVAMELAAHRPVLVIVDPLYLAARGAKGSSLYEMGEHLETVQRLACGVGAALVVVHHWNKSGEGKGASRMTGSGPAEWGRVLVSVAVRSSRMEEFAPAAPSAACPGGTAAQRVSHVALEFGFVGDEIPDTDLLIRRSVWADDKDDLDSQLNYDLERLELDDNADAPPGDMSALAGRVLSMINTAGVDGLNLEELGDECAKQGSPRRRVNIEKALKELAMLGLATGSGGVDPAHHPWRWRAS